MLNFYLFQAYGRLRKRAVCITPASRLVASIYQFPGHILRHPVIDKRRASSRHEHLIKVRAKPFISFNPLAIVIVNAKHTTPRKAVIAPANFMVTHEHQIWKQNKTNTQAAINKAHTLFSNFDKQRPKWDYHNESRVKYY